MLSRYTKFAPSYAFRPDMALYILLGVMFGFLIVTSIKGAVLLAVAFVVLLLFSRSPLVALLLLVAMIPFSATSVLRDPLEALKGVKAVHMLSMFALLIALVNYKQVVRMPKYAVVFTILYLTIFSISAIQALPNMESINLRWIEEGRQKLSTLPFILKIYARPLILFIPFIIIIKFCRTVDHVRYITNTLVLSIVTLSIYLVYLDLFEIKGGVEEATDYYGSVLGHRNHLADLCVTVFPFALARYFLNKTITNIASMCLIVAAIGLLYTRTAYVILPLAFISYLVISKRVKFLPVLIAVAFGVSFFISTTIIERASKGIDAGNVDEISSGRVYNQWLPLLEEYTQNPRKLLLGNGRYAMVSSEGVARGFVPESMLHPHNMYLEQILDAGIFALIFMLWFFLFLLRKAYRCLRLARDDTMREYLYAVMISVSSYLAAGMTGRTLFPGLQNSLFWIIVGVTIVIVRLLEQSSAAKEHVVVNT